MKMLLSITYFFLLGLETQALTGGERLNLKTFESPGAHRSVVGFAIEIKEADTKAHLKTNYCSGTILGTQRVLTAAHCVAPVAPGHRRRIRMHFGPEVDGRGISDVSIQEREIHLHPKYDWKNPKAESNAKYDLAILKLTNPLPEMAKPITLPNLTLSDFSDIILIGYGTSLLNAESERSEDWGYLRMARNTHWTWLEDQHSLRIDQNVEPGLCKGDSGSPALIDLGNLEFMILGVAHTVEANLTETEQTDLQEHGFKNFLSRHPHVNFCKGLGYFIDIRPHLDWILSLLA